MILGLQLLCMILGYCVGALPTASLLMKIFGVKELERSGFDENPFVATLEVVRARPSLLRTQILLSALDALKGALAVCVGRALFVAAGGVEQTSALQQASGAAFILPALAGFFCVLGHNYNMIFRHAASYGRGLGVAAGVMTLLNPAPTIVFLICWLTGYFVIRRNIFVGVVSGAIATPILVYNAPDDFARVFAWIAPIESTAPFTFFVFILCMQIFVRHLEPMRALFAGDDEASS